jgi:acetylornithine deacetylase
MFLPMVDPRALHRRLAELVAFDTQNPSGDERPLAEKLALDLRALGGSGVETFITGGHASTYARFGASRARLLLNAHIDTVPANTGYSHPPHELIERDGHLIGLGSADTKGAIAAILEALTLARAAGRPIDGVAVLFSGDEESGGVCMRDFLEGPRGRALAADGARAIACEPTGLRVGQRHRGIVSASISTTSPGGHSSRADELPAPVATLARAAVAIDDLGRRYRHVGAPGFEGLCMNVAAIQGGVAFNVIPTRATLQICFRPGPGSDPRALLAEIEAVSREATAPVPLDLHVEHLNPPFATRDLDGFVPLLGARARAPIDLAFWTEAALLVEHGIDAVVFGPGGIDAAHAADERVELAQLVTATEVFLEALTST